MNRSRLDKVSAEQWARVTSQRWLSLRHHADDHQLYLSRCVRAIVYLLAVSFYGTADICLVLGSHSHKHTFSLWMLVPVAMALIVQRDMSRRLADLSLDDRARLRFGKDFMDLQERQRAEVALDRLDRKDTLPADERLLTEHTRLDSGALRLLVRFMFLATAIVFLASRAYGAIEPQSILEICLDLMIWISSIGLILPGLLGCWAKRPA